MLPAGRSGVPIFCKHSSRFNIGRADGQSPSNTLYRVFPIPASKVWALGGKGAQNLTGTGELASPLIEGPFELRVSLPSFGGNLIS